MSRIFVAALALILALSIVAPVVSFAQNQPVTITVGGLLPLTGDLADYGKRAQAALQVAKEDVNAYLEQKGAWFRIDLRIEDTGTNPDLAVQKFNSLVAAGIKFIIGPMTSAEATKLKDPATQQNVLLISPSSTALQLKLPGDNLYRFCPSDDVQSKAVVRVLEDLGIKAVVIIVRADTWGLGLRDEIVKLLDQAGIEYAAPLEYNPESPNFGAIASQANAAVEDFIKKYGVEKVAVILIAFAEAADLFQETSQYDALRSVVWIGSDGTARIDEIAKDPTASQFAKDTMFINPIFSPAATDVQKQVAQKVKDLIGQEPDAYSYASYDALWAIALALLDASPDMSPDELVNHVKQKLEQGITQSDEFAAHASTGAFPLDEGGDRATADYDWWIIYDVGGQLDWVMVGKYIGAEDKNEWTPIDGKTYPQLVAEKPRPYTGKGVGLSTALIAGIVVVIIIIVAAIFLLRGRS